MPIKAYKYRLYPNKVATEKLNWALERCRELYNAALQERKEAWKYAHKSVSYPEQCRSLTEIRHEIRPEYEQIGAHVSQNVLKRVDLAYQMFYSRAKNAEKAGFPRFKGKNQYESFTYPDLCGWKLEGEHLRLAKIGTIKIKLHREIIGKIKTLTIKREGEHWYAVFTCEIEAEKLPLSYEDVGIDLGITHFAALSDGTFIEPPRYFRRSEKKLAKLQQALTRKKHGSYRRQRTVRQIARLHRKVRNQRKDFLHKASHQVVNRYQVVVFEDLQVANLTKRPGTKQDETTGQYIPNGANAKAGLNKSILDAGWSMFTQMCVAKAASAGRTIVFVNPYKTSQICSQCLKQGPHKDLAERVHACPHCGVVLDRDTNAAINILRLGRSQQSNPL